MPKIRSFAQQFAGGARPNDWIDKIRGKVTVDYQTGCWIYKERGRYHTLTYDGKPTPIHRITYAFANGNNTFDHLEVHHECGEKACINPAHLLAMDHRSHLGAHAQARRNGGLIPPDTAAQRGQVGY